MAILPSISVNFQLLSSIKATCSHESILRIWSAGSREMGKMGYPGYPRRHGDLGLLRIQDTHIYIHIYLFICLFIYVCIYLCV